MPRAGKRVSASLEHTPDAARPADVVMQSPCGAGVIAGGVPAATPRLSSHASAVLAATILGSSVAFIDSSVVNVALPILRRDLSASVAQMQWVINGYLLPLSAFVLIGGAAGDRFGRRRTFILGLVVFIVASLGCAAAPTVTVLVAARALQGIGAALLVPTSLAILGTGFSGEARGRAIGTWAAAGAITAAVGPVLGGWLVDVIGWRAIFFINIPLALGAIWLARRYVPDLGEGSLSLDWRGAGLVVFGLGAIVWGLTALPTHSIHAPLVRDALIAGPVALIAFVIVEHLQGQRAMVPLTLFRSRTYVGVTLLTLFLYATLGGMVVLLPYVLITVGHYSAAAAGAALLPLPILMGLTSRTVGHWAELVGPRIPLTVGPLCVAVGLGLWMRFEAGHLHYWRDVFPAVLALAIGLSLSVAPLTATVMEAVDPSRAGSASGINDAIAYVAGLIATALLGLVLVPGGGMAPSMIAVHGAALVGAALATAAAASALLLV
jgi:EmrB/QacA subfamily drug resistance transporter